jgi:hypothetical protein
MRRFLDPKLSAVSYLCLLIVFLLPFVEVQWNGRPIRSLNGYEVAFERNDATRDLPAFKARSQAIRQLVASAFVLSLLAGVVAMASGVASSLISGIALILLIVARPECFGGEIQQETASIIGFEYKQLGYYLSLILLACGSVFGIIATRVQATLNADTRGFEQLHALLKELSLLAKFKKFKEHNANDGVLPYLTDEQLRDIGIKKAANRACLLARFGSLRGENNAC